MATPLPTPQSVIRTRFLHDLNDGTLWGWHVDLLNVGQSPDAAALLTFATEMGQYYQGTLIQLLSVNWQLAQTECHDLSKPNLLAQVDATPLVGTRPGTNLDSGRSAVMVHHPDRRYRGGRPKSFTMFGVREDYGTDQTWSAAFITEMEAAWVAFIATCKGAKPNNINISQQEAVFFTGPPYTVVTNPHKTRSYSIGTPLDHPVLAGGAGSARGISSGPLAVLPRQRPVCNCQ